MRTALAAAVLSAAVIGINFVGPATSRAAGVAENPAQQPANAPSQTRYARSCCSPAASGTSSITARSTGNGARSCASRPRRSTTSSRAWCCRTWTRAGSTAVTYPSQDPDRQDAAELPGGHHRQSVARRAAEPAPRGQGQAARHRPAEIDGTILGVEKKQSPSAGQGDGSSHRRWVLNLINGADHPQPSSWMTCSDVELDDPQLREELAKALAALAQARDQDKKPVTIHFSGAGRATRAHRATSWRRRSGRPAIG